ncbi:MAG: hypothetical protein M1419_08245 [Bacteroidetes bacterium]|nr:hypothetical protein [Bacteroidota bacterium]
MSVEIELTPPQLSRRDYILIFIITRGGGIAHGFDGWDGFSLIFINLIL